LHARLATDAALVVEINDAVFSTEKRYGGTNFNTGSVIAVVAAEHREVPAGIRIVPLFDVFDPGAINTHCDVVFLFAGNRACVTTDTTILIDDESVAHFRPFESDSRRKIEIFTF
jgi:hypothetical protein